MQRCNRPCANEYWPEICASIHSAVETGIIKIIQDRAQQMERWVEHDSSELSARENMVSLEALNAIECLPVLGDLDSGDLLIGAERGPEVPAPGKARGQDGNTLPVLEGEKVPQ